MATGAPSSSQNSKPITACEMARILLEAPETDVLAPGSPAGLVRHSGTVDAPVTHKALAEPRQCDACDDGWALLEEDALCDGHYERALGYKDRVQTYINQNPNCTIDDLRSHFGCPEATLRICLHLLVDRHEIRGTDPYACDASQGRDQMLAYSTIHLPLRSSE